MISGLTLVAQVLKVNKPTPADDTLERVEQMKFLTCIETQLISTWLHVMEIALSKSNFSGHKYKKYAISI